MHKLRSLIIVLSLALVGAAIAIEVAVGQATDPSILKQEVQGESMREISAPPTGKVPDQPNIGFIDSPSATCYQPDPSQNNCYISWYYLSVDASPNYMITMTTFLNDFGPVAHTQGFFQTSMYVPYNMLGQGFKVPCGSPGAGGDPQLGKAYAYTVRARDSANLGSANYGTVYCPPYTP
jgi:hypothetical protein